MNARLARVVDLKFFCGFSFPEIASIMGVSERTAQRDWEKARTCLHRVVQKNIPGVSDVRPSRGSLRRFRSMLLDHSDILPTLRHLRRLWEHSLPRRSTVCQS